MGSIFKGRMIPKPAKVAKADHTHHTMASVGSHEPRWVRMCVQVSLPKHKEHEDKEQSQEVNIDSTDALVSVVASKNGQGVEGHGCQEIPCPMLVRCFHFATFTPFTSSHRQKDDSPTNGGSRIAGIIRSANAGANSTAKQAVK